MYLFRRYAPIAQYVFAEAFPHPSTAHEARTRYTRSTAVATICGALINYRNILNHYQLLLSLCGDRR